MVCIVLMMQQRPRKITPLHMLGIGIDDEHVYVQAEKVPSAGGETPSSCFASLPWTESFSMASGRWSRMHDLILGSALQS